MCRREIPLDREKAHQGTEEGNLQGGYLLVPLPTEGYRQEGLGDSASSLGVGRRQCSASHWWIGGRLGISLRVRGVAWVVFWWVVTVLLSCLLHSN